MAISKNSILIHSPRQVLRFVAAQVDSRSPLLGSLATCGADGVAAARTVVIRGASVRSNLIWLSTHVESEKVTALRLHPISEIVIWFPAERLQVRLRARWRIIDDKTRANVDVTFRRKAWLAHSPASTELFITLPPGTPVALVSQAKLSDDTRTRRIPPPAFAVLVGKLELADVLLTGDAPHRRFLHRRLRGKWTSLEVVP